VARAPYYLPPKHELLEHLDEYANNSHVDAKRGGDTQTAKATENTEREQWELDSGFSLVA
jgi:hypothetical protein